MTKEFLVIQHSPWEGPGVFLRNAMKRHGIRLRILQAYKDPFPRQLPDRGLILLGGAPNVDEEEQHPFLVTEKRYIHQAIATDLPILGICLGHQLLAQALGAKVGPNFKVCIGFLDGHLTHAGKEHPAFVGLPSRLPLFKWHGQAVLDPLPDHLQILATSADCQVEAFSVAGRPYIIGVQNDNHTASPGDLAQWAQHDPWVTTLERQGIPVRQRLLAPLRTTELIEEHFNIFINNFLLLP